MKPKVKQRLQLALELRDEKAFTFKDIGRTLGVCRQRACEIYRQAQHVLQGPKHWSDGLSIRCCNCLEGLDIKSKEEVCAAIMTGRLSIKTPLHVRNYGKKTHAEVLKWLKEHDPVALAFTIDV